jgi:hypothetical protein
VTQGDKRERAQILPTVNRIRGIEAAVVAWIHEMVAQVSFELAFSTRQSAVFEEAQRAIDSRLAATGGRALERIDAIYERLADPRNAEAISQALTTCRRLIVAVADALYPPSDTPVQRQGQDIKVTSEHVLNRIELFVSDHCESESRRKRLKRAIRDLWERVSAGVHSDVDAGEARFLFLHAYIVLGEIVLLSPVGAPGPPVS